MTHVHEPVFKHRGERLSFEEVQARLPDGFVVAGRDGRRNGRVFFAFASEAEFAEQAPQLGLDPERSEVIAVATPPEPVYVYDGRRLSIDEAREHAPDGVVFAGPDSEADGVFYVLDSEDQLPKLARKLGRRPSDFHKWMTLTLPPQVVFLFRERELTLEQLEQLENPTVLAGPTTETDGRFFVFDPDEPVREQAVRIGLDPDLMEKWSAQNA